MNDLELDERLRTDAARWNAVRPAGPELARAIERLSTDVTPRPRSWRRHTLAVAAAALLVSAIAIAVDQLRPGETKTASSKPLITCGHAPTSDGPYASRVVLRLRAPASAISGHTIHPQLSIRAAGSLAVRLDVGQPAAVYITQHGEIVGRYNGAVAGTGLGMIVTREPTPIPVVSVLLSGCPHGKTDYMLHPDATRQPLPPGHYQLVATLDGDEGVGHQWQLVSEPRNITITNAH